ATVGLRAGATGGVALDGFHQPVLGRLPDDDDVLAAPQAADVPALRLLHRDSLEAVAPLQGVFGDVGGVAHADAVGDVDAADLARDPAGEAATPVDGERVAGEADHP